MTGQMGDVMKESAQIALTYVRSICPDYQVADDYFEKHDLHMHIPEGAVPKDGPSAGITMATAMLLCRDRTEGSGKSSHDRRDYLARKCASDRRPEGEDPGSEDGPHEEGSGSG